MPAISPTATTATAPPQPEDDVLIDRLRTGDAEAFHVLVRRHDRALQRFARSRAPSTALADDAVQDTWLAVIRGIDGFEGRSSFRGWAFGILLNRLRSRIRREDRLVPFSALPGFDTGAGRSDPEHDLLAREAVEVLGRAIAQLPPGQREVITLRMRGCTSTEACDRLGVTACHQRVLLHRARRTLRQALDRYAAP